MTRMVFCKKYQQELEGMERAPFPGPKGQELFDNVSRKAWDEWQAHQTRLINEKQLSMMDPDARRYLQEQQQKFFSNEDFDQADGYVPEAQ